MTNPFSLHGRRALVTGANTGIGQAIAMGLADAGATVVCAGRSASDETVDRITKAGGTAALCHVDFADPMAAQGLFADQNFDILIKMQVSSQEATRLRPPKPIGIPLWM